MVKRSVPKGRLRIKRLRLSGRVARDLFHIDVPVDIDEMEVDAEIGGDAVNSKTPPKRAAPRKRRRRVAATTRKVLTHAIIGAGSIAGMVAASGITFALGWG